MPEGDTIFRTARTLHAALAGRTVTGFETRLAALDQVDRQSPLVGRTVVGARSVGKHLLIEFSDDLVLRSHMRMNGSWHIYRPGERWQRPRFTMRIVIATGAYVAVAFDVPIAEFLTLAQLERHRELSALGPDLLAETFARDEVIARLRARPAATVGEALLNQRVMAGVGNVFKSEALFLCGLSPFCPVSQLGDERLGRLIDTARELMRANVPAPGPNVLFRGYRRTTRMADPAAGLWVYGRAGRPCRRCGTPIEHRKQGEDARGTYWCPACQG